MLSCDKIEELLTKGIIELSEFSCYHNIRAFGKRKLLSLKRIYIEDKK